MPRLPTSIIMIDTFIELTMTCLYSFHVVADRFQFFSQGEVSSQDVVLSLLGIHKIIKNILIKMTIK